MQENELRIIAVDIRAHDVRLARYNGAHGIFIGLAKLAEPQSDGVEITATLRAADGKGGSIPSLAIYRVNDNFSTTAPNPHDHCFIVRAELQSHIFGVEAYEPRVATVFAGLNEIAALASEGGVTIPIKLTLECSGNPRFAFTLYRSYNDVILRVEQGKPHIAEA